MLTVIIKGTSGCNLRCKYCSLGDKSVFYSLDKQRLQEIISFIGELCIARRENKLSIILHGGEPMLIDTEIYDNAFETIKTSYPELQTDFRIQTNGYLLTDKYIEFFKKWDIGVGVSLDGSEIIHDAQRVDINGQPTFHRVTQNISRLQQSDISVSALMVLTRNALNKGFDFLDYFEKTQIPLKINPLLNYGDAIKHSELELSSGEYADYLIDLYEYICKYDKDVTVSPLEGLLSAFLHKTNINECTHSADCSKNFLAIDYNGDIFPCGKFSDISEYKLGSIYEPIELVSKNISQNGLYARRNIAIPAKCADCRFVNKCHAGCSAEAVIYGVPHKETPMCNDHYKLFSYFESSGLKVLKQYLLRRRNKIISEMNKLGI